MKFNLFTAIQAITLFGALATHVEAKRPTQRPDGEVYYFTINPSVLYGSDGSYFERRENGLFYFFVCKYQYEHDNTFPKRFAGKDNVGYYFNCDDASKKYRTNAPLTINGVEYKI
ncbi:hypothetical protein BDF19DRAFT_423308 [Syncephalis fuscata]|nr:hypothetical protein BDF19DRAFT_423308 [Syncephalis fuscata]